MDGCELKPVSRGLCNGHYDRLLKTGDVRADVPLRVNGSQKNKSCAVATCDEPAFCKDWCRAHYQRWKINGDVRADIPINGHLREYPEGHSWCPKCEQMLPLDQFHVSKDRARGVTAVCAECIRANQKTKREQIYAQQKRWRDANLERSRATRREWERKNPDKVRAKRQRLLAKHPERYRKIARAAEYRRKARELNAPGNATVDQILARWAYYGSKCWICGKDAEHTDHVKPLSKGGSNWPANLRPACSSCNRAKNAKWPFKPEDIAHIWAA